MSASSEDIHVVFHVAAIPGSDATIAPMVNSIEQSGLLDASVKIHVITVGDLNSINLSPVESGKYKIYSYSKDISYCEFPSINFVKFLSNKIDGKICYVHTKGVTRRSESVNDWRDYLSYFNIERWEDRLKDLTSYDTTGVNLLGSKDFYNNHPGSWAVHPSTAPLHYSGNFWWANAEYVRGLPEPMSGYTPDEDWSRWRHMCEMWVCYTAEGKHACAHQSGVDHYFERYPESNYRK